MTLRDQVARAGPWVAIIWGLAGAGTTLGIYVYLKFGTADVSSCQGGDVLSWPLNAVYLLTCLSSFLVGGLATWLPRTTRAPSRDPMGSPGTPAGGVLQFVLLVVLLVLSFLLFYEAWSLSPLNSRSTEFWPITYFVRCASRLALIGALPVVSLMCAFFGKWIWYRPMERIA